MTRFSLLFVLIGLISLTSNAQLEFEHGGLTRTYYMDAPDPIPDGAPLVVVLHGYTSSAVLIRAYSNWDELALSEGFVAVFPQGTEDNFGINHWNANLGNSDTDAGCSAELPRADPERPCIASSVRPQPLGPLAPSKNQDEAVIKVEAFLLVCIAFGPRVDRADRSGEPSSVPAPTQATIVNTTP